MTDNLLNLIRQANETKRRLRRDRARAAKYMDVKGVLALEVLSDELGVPMSSVLNAVIVAAGDWHSSVIARENE